MLIDQWLAPLYSLHLVDVSIHFKFNLLPPKHCLAKQIIIIRSSVPWGMYEADPKAIDCSPSQWGPTRGLLHYSFFTRPIHLGLTNKD